MNDFQVFQFLHYDHSHTDTYQAKVLDHYQAPWYTYNKTKEN